MTVFRKDRMGSVVPSKKLNVFNRYFNIYDDVP